MSLRSALARCLHGPGKQLPMVHRRAAALLVFAQLGCHGAEPAKDLADCRWTDSTTGAAFDLSPLAPASGHLAFHGVIGDHDSLLASVGYHAGFELADYIYYVNLCAPATGFSFDKCDGKPLAAAYQTHKDTATHDDCFSLGHPDRVRASLIDPSNPEVGLQLLFSGGDDCHKEVHHPKSSRGCADTPGFADSEGRSCEQYASQNLCGAKFIPSLGVNGRDAHSACCASCTDWWKTTVKCPKLERPENGAAVVYTNLRKWPSLATYECESGYTLSGGFSKRECQPSGEWQGSAPQCIDEPYYGRGGRMGRYNHDSHHGDSGNQYGDGDDSAETVSPAKRNPCRRFISRNCV